MGNQDSKHLSQLKDWEKVQTENQIEIFKNRRNNQIAEKRIVSIDPHFDLDDQLEIYDMRQYNTDSLVRTFAARQVQNKSHSKGICSGHKKLQVFTQRIPYRLTDLPQLTFPYSLLFLRQALRAYNKVFRSYGPVHVTKKMIGINVFGQVKCWVNQNWALNHPNHEFPILQSTKLKGISEDKQYDARSQVYDARYRDQTEMVHNIVGVVEYKCEQGKFPQAFSQQIQHHSLTFRKLTMYLEDFIGINQLFIPPKINYDTVFISKYQNNREVNQSTAQMNAQNHKNTREVNQSYAQFNAQNNQNSQNHQNYQNNMQITQGNSQNQNMANYGTNSQSFGQIQTSMSPNLRQPYASHLGYSNDQSGYQNANKGQSYNLTSYQPQTHERSIGSYTNTVTTKTIGNSVALNQSVHNQPISTHSIAPNWTAQNSNTHWKQSESTYKPIQNQSNYSSSYYQYSTSLPSVGNVANSSNFGTYNLGGHLTNNQLLSKNQLLTKTQLNKPSSHTTLSNRLGSGSNNSNSSNYAASNNYQNRMANYDSIGGLSNNYNNFYSTQQNKNVGSTTSKTYEQFKKEFGHVPLTGANYTSNSYHTTSKMEPSYSDSADKSFTYSFDGRQEFANKFGEYSAGKEYSSSNNYQTSTSNNPIALNTTGMGIQGKYTDQFNTLLGSFTKNQNFTQSHNNYTGGTQRIQDKSNFLFMKDYGGSNFGQNLTSQAGENALQGLMKMVQREVNQPLNTLQNK